MEIFLPIAVIIPLLGCFVTFLIPERKENLIGLITHFFAATQLVAVLIFTILWVFLGHPSISVNEFSVYHTTGYDFFVDFMFDKVSAVYLLFSTVLFFLITVYSKYYLHREEGYKRFFNTVFLFICGINTIVLSGNFETLFIGWEFLGISSFLLIAFYRNRYLPVRNALKIFTLYRIADIGILLTMWLSHHMWHKNITFIELENSDLVLSNWDQHWYIGLLITITLIVAAAVKSAQFPFCFWLPRAMEGPTPSSAIFYGSIAVHIGAFLLMRTYPFWSVQMLGHELIAGVGLISFILASLSARVQTSIKAQIAYSSIAQIGLIFIEIALNWQILALIHLTGNAFLRAYQLLISPSVVTYSIREQFFNFEPSKSKKSDNKSFKKLRYTIYVLSLKEWKLESFLFKTMWIPWKFFGNKLKFITWPIAIIPSMLCIVMLVLQFTINLHIPYMAEVSASVATVALLISFTERTKYMMSWFLIVFSHFFIANAVLLNEEVNMYQILLYLSGVVIAGGIGLLILRNLRKKERFDLNEFHGFGKKYKSHDVGFFLASISLAGFPLTSTFLGEDLMFLHVHEDQFLLVILFSLSFILTGISLVRMYSRIFMGQYKYSDESKALRAA